MSTSDAAAEPALAPSAIGQPRWLLSALYGLVATLAVCAPVWPGLMSYDSMFAYTEARTGIQTMIWPPMHAYLFWISQAVGADGWGLFVAQTFLLFFAAALSLNLLVRRTPWALFGLAVFSLWFVYLPELLGTAIVQWRDVTTTSFAFAALAAWLLAARGRSLAWLVTAGLCVGMAAALRYNAVLLAAPIAPLMIWRPYLTPPAPRPARVAIAAVMVLGLGLAWASTHWRLPDLKAPPAAHDFGGTQEFDLIGISACADTVYLPPAFSNGAPISPRQIRMAYDPRHLELSMRPVPGVPRFIDIAAGEQVRKIWPLAVREQFGCYLAHRAAVFVEVMGLSRQGVFIPAGSELIANPYGLKLAHPAQAQTVIGYLRTRAPEYWRRPILAYLLAPFAVAALWLRRNSAGLLMLAMLGGAYAYAAALFVAAPAADARYIFPSTAFCAFIVSATAAVLLAQRRTPVERLLERYEGRRTAADAGLD